MTQAGAPRLDRLALGIQRIEQLEQFDSPDAHRQILEYLNQWIEPLKPDPHWIADPMFDRLPTRLEKIKRSARLSRMSFDSFDLFVLREAIWMRDTSRRVCQSELHDRPLADWLATRFASEPETGVLVGEAQRLFDWTVRNIQLEAESPRDHNPDDPSNQTTAQVTDVPPGPRHYAWESMQLGHGTTWERSRIFTLLARQRGIDVAILAVADSALGEPTPWLCAALVEKQLYLFDCRLGLPLPGPGGQGIATLEQVIDDPALLRQLDLPSGPESRYPMRASKLDQVVALIDATPAYLSQRMKLIESTLYGDNQLTLSLSPALMARQLRSCRGIRDVALWTYPYDGFLVKASLATDRKAVDALAREHAALHAYPPLGKGRHWHLCGIMDKQADHPGARGYYLQCLVPEQEIRQIDQPAVAEKLLGGAGSLPADPATRAALLAKIQESMTLVKLTANYWLGLILFEGGDFGAAANYFEKRTLGAAPDGPWATGARYNLARCYEAMGLAEPDPEPLKKARQYYLSDESSPQRHGNQLRARRLETLIQQIEAPN